MAGVAGVGILFRDHIRFSTKKPLEKQGIIRAALERLVRIFDEEGIPYWITQGTLLGYLRYGDVLLCDNDADIAVLARDRDRVFEVLDRHKVYNAAAKALYHVGRIAGHDEMGAAAPIGIYFMHATPDGRYIYAKTTGKNGWSYGDEIPVDKIFPLRRAAFGHNFEVNIPQDPEFLSAQTYGRAWRRPYHTYEDGQCLLNTS